MTEPQTLREAALQAAEDAQAARLAVARATLANALRPAEVTSLQVVDDAGEVAVFADTEGTSLSVRGAVVSLVTGEPGDWTSRGAVTTLAELGLLLDAN
jgi:hypothetical protein